MLNSLRGIVTAVGANYVRIESSGVEWELEVSAESARHFRAGNAEQRILTHLYHREDTMRLYGFASAEERRLFLELLKVGGIGPKQALRILSGAALEEILRAINDGAVDELARFPGLGTKSAQKIVLTLKGKLAAGGGEAGGSAAAQNQELIEALVAMGFERKAAAQALTDAAASLRESETPGEEWESSLLRQAIVLLS